MLSTAIKNTILIILIIFIIHFIIKNHLASSKAAHISADSKVSLTTQKSNEGFESPVENSTDSIINYAKDPSLNDEEELLKYVLANKNTEFASSLPSCPEVKTDIPSIDILTTKKSKPVVDSQAFNQMMFIGSYDDEKSMNGGEVFGGLHGFDESTLPYEAYTPSL